MKKRTRRYVRVPSHYVTRSREFGIAFVKRLTNGELPQVLARAGGRGSEFDVELQARSKIGEVAGAIYYHVDPESLLWSVDRPDRGHDFRFAGLAIDAKTNYPPYKLIWSKNVNDLYFQKDFDALLSVSISSREYADCWIEGWMGKEEFYRRKLISDGSRLERDTWFMDKSDLHDVDDLHLCMPYGRK